MKLAPIVSVLFLIATPALAQSSPEDNDKRPVQAHFYELTPLKPGPDFAASLKLPRGYRAAVWAKDLGNTRVMAAAVPTHLDNLMTSAHRNADSVVVVHSTDDTVLRRWFRLGQTIAREGRFPEALGYAGNPHDPPWSAHRQMLGFEHSDYWSGKSTADIIGAQPQVLFLDVVYGAQVYQREPIPARASLHESALLTEYEMTIS